LNVRALVQQPEVCEADFLIFYAVFLFDVVVKVEWSFVVNSSEGLILEETLLFPVFKESM